MKKPNFNLNNALTTGSIALGGLFLMGALVCIDDGNVFGSIVCGTGLCCMAFLAAGFFMEG